MAKPLEHKPYHCPICGKRFMNIYGQPLPNHTQIQCITTDGNEMDFGVCRDCADAGVTQEMIESILEGIKIYWTNEIDDNKELKAKDKKARKDFHNSHKIDHITKIVRTGERAEKDARKRGKLL